MNRSFTNPSANPIAFDDNEKSGSNVAACCGGQWLAFACLVAVGVAVRVGLQHIPNFAPVAAIGLFAGFFFRSRLLAFGAPLAIMVISDRLVEAGSYSLPLMLTVYGLLALPVLLGSPMRRSLSMNVEGNSIGRALGSVVALIGCSLGCSLLFFLGTNFMVWATSSWYEPTLAGLAKCYVSALPFFRYTVAGDAIFSTILFGGYVFATAGAYRTRLSAEA